MKKRSSVVSRKTKETAIRIDLNLDGSGKNEILFPIPFLGHMLQLFSKHGLFDLKINALQKINYEDLKIDIHHLVEDTGLALGEAFSKALGKRERIERYGHAIIPMDESLAEVRAAADISGRPHFTFKAKFLKQLIMIPIKDRELRSYLDAEMLREFFESFVYKAGVSLHIDLIRGKSTHHKIEAIFKAFGVALSKACSISPRKKGVPSTKGVL